MPQMQAVIPKGFEVQYEEWGLAPAIRVGDTIYCSGQLGIGSDGSLPSDSETQFANAFDAVKATLEAAGSGLADIVEMTTFHVGLVAELETFARVRARYVSEPWPAQTAIGVAELGLPGALVEIKVTAVIGAGSAPATKT
jgi:enamine deaminase RidA (YjgF/YER057c/UK114 family)